MTELLSVKDLSVAFTADGKENLVVDKVSFSIAKGETLALVGESGSGKSVSAASIVKLLPYPPASHPSGEIFFNGKDMIKAKEKELRHVRGDKIAMIFQEPMTSLNPLHVIEKQISEVLVTHQGMSKTKAHKRVIELLNKVGIHNPETRLNDYPHQLSGGQRQRVMIAMALANEPDLLIADEPTTALDVTIQAQILELLQSLQKEMGMAILLITHDLGIVHKIADNVCVMTKGKIVEKGNAKEVFNNPKHSYTKHLLASEPKGLVVPVHDAAETIIKADNLRVWFPIKRGLFHSTVGHIKAVDGIDLEVKEGQTLGIVGESGSGKTTLGLALLRLISSKGKIAYIGNQIDSYNNKQMRPLRKDMQVVFQDPYGSLSPRMSVRQIIVEGLLVHKGALDYYEQKEIVSKAMEEVGLDPDMQERYPHEFSGGQRQRIAIARAMVLEPKFVMLDEPTSALDLSMQAQLVELLRNLQVKHKFAYLFISHDLKVVKALANEVIVMRFGKVVEQGATEQIFENPQTDYTKALIKAAFDFETAPLDILAS